MRVFLWISNSTSVLSKEFLDIQVTIECGFTLKCVCDMIRTYSQMHHTDEHSQHNLVILPVWLNVWVFVYELSGCVQVLLQPLLFGTFLRYPGNDYNNNCTFNLHQEYCLTKWLWVRILLQSLKFQILHLFWAWSSLTFRQL